MKTSKIIIITLATIMLLFSCATTQSSRSSTVSFRTDWQGNRFLDMYALSNNIVRLQRINNNYSFFINYKAKAFAIEAITLTTNNGSIYPYIQESIIINGQSRSLTRQENDSIMANFFSLFEGEVSYFTVTLQGHIVDGIHRFSHTATIKVTDSRQIRQIINGLNKIIKG